MITRMIYTSLIDCIDDELGFAVLFIALPLTIVVDLVLILFQPVFYIIYKKWEEENE